MKLSSLLYIRTIGVYLDVEICNAISIENPKDSNSWRNAARVGICFSIIDFSKAILAMFSSEGLWQKSKVDFENETFFSSKK